MGILSELFGNKTTNSKQQDIPENVYSRMSHYQKLAAMNLMMAFAGSCSGSPHEISKINHIMTQESQLMGISGNEMHAATSRFNGMKGMADALKGTDRRVLEELFWAFYCIVAVGKDSQAVQILLLIYKDYGFSEQDCVSILEKKSGRKII